MRSGKRIYQVLCVMLVATIVGCPREAGPPVAVSGHVSFAGATLRNGYVVFVPDASHGEQGPIAVGKINVDGSYALKTGDLAGAAPGFYRVAISAVGPGAALPGQHGSFPQLIIPEKYSDPNLSELACEVKAQHANTINFDLK